MPEGCICYDSFLQSDDGIANTETIIPTVVVTVKDGFTKPSVTVPTNARLLPGF